MRVVTISRSILRHSRRSSSEVSSPNARQTTNATDLRPQGSARAPHQVGTVHLVHQQRVADLVRQGFYHCIASRRSSP